MKHRDAAVVVALCLAAVGVLGCPSDGPAPVMTVSHWRHNFPLNEAVWTFTVANDGEEGSHLAFAVKSNAPWLKVSPQAAFNLDSGDSRNVTVTVDRTLIVPKTVQAGTLYITALNASQVAEIQITTEADVAPPTGMTVYPIAGFESEGIDLIKTSDGGFAILCRDDAQSYENNCRRIVKTDAAGNLQWQSQYGQWDYIYGLSEAADGGYNLFGEIYAYSMDDWSLLRATADAGGAILDRLDVGGMEMAVPYSVLPLESGGCVYAGVEFEYPSYSGHPFILGIAPDGQTEWKHDLEDDSIYISDVEAAPDGGYVVVGDARLEGDGERWSSAGTLIRTDAQGVEVWQRTFESVGMQSLYAGTFVEDGSIVAGGEMEFRAAILRTVGDGTVLTARPVGPQKEGRINGVLPLTDGGCLATGATCILRGESDWNWKRMDNIYQVDGRALVVKLDAQGEVAWWREYAGPGEDEALEAVETAEGYVVLGTTYSYGPGECAPFLLFLDGQGNPRVP